MDLLVGFQDEFATDPAVVGRKFAALARAARAGFAVPDAFAIATRAHALFRATGIWPEALRAAVVARARGLDLARGLSVRSSAVREDLDGQSFAGQYLSFLEVGAEADLIASIEACWASAGSETVRSYLQAIRQPGADGEAPVLGVIVQRMVKSAIAGVAFSRNPLQPGSDAMVIEAVQGQGEGLVSGRLTPCRAEVARTGQVSVAAGGDRRLRRRTPWRDIADLLAHLERAWQGTPLDVEWAVDGRGRLWLLQVRPITTLDADGLLPPAGSWTRKIADDLWADRLEPFTTDVMLAHAPRFDLSRISRLCGITPVQPALAVIHGYLYVNCRGIRQLVAYLPRPLRLKDLATLLPAGTRLDDISPPRPATLVRVLLRICALPLSEPGALAPVCLVSARRTIRRIRARLAAAAQPGPGRSATARLQEGIDLLAELQEKNQWPYSHATVFAWLLRALAVDRFGLSGADFLGLISRGSDNVTIRIEQWFRSMAAQIAADPHLRERFLDRGADALPPGLRAELDGFLGRYGCRSRHRTLLVKRWAETPEDIAAILQSLVRAPQGMAGAFSPGEAPRANLLLQGLAALARRFFDLREELRFLLDEVLYRLRRDLLDLGGRFGIGEDIFFLKPGEIGELAAERLTPTDAAATAARRRRQFAREIEPAAFWVDGNPEYDFTPGGAVLKGIGTSPGRVSGRAVVVEDPARADIRPGDIVIACHTDPGWTPILSVVGGIIMEEGGLLNHCSIVARELGIPSIVGVRRATRVVPVGARVTMDGASGEVRIETEEGTR
jgi:pyruvate,water dikinase